MDTNILDRQPFFITGGGEMGKLIREKDWASTPVGDMQHWPQSLRTTLSIILNSGFPMFLWWGPELICFYNDAYRPSLGNDGKHPHILGMPAREAWSEIWDFIKPAIDQVMAGGPSTWNEDQLVPIFRNGKMEDVYWTYSYSPVYGESGTPQGVMVTCYETTDKVFTLKQLEEKKDELEFAIEATELGTFDYNPQTGKFSSNDRLKQWFGLHEKENIALEHALKAIAPEDRERVAQAIKKVTTYGHDENCKYDIHYTVINAVTGKKTVVSAKGRVWFNDDKQPARFNGTLQDITEQKLFEQNLENLVQQRTSELAQNNIDLAKINKELQSFSYVSSHDLKEPLRKIQSFSNIIYKRDYDNLSESGKDSFERIQKSIKRMQVLIDDLLSYSRTDVVNPTFVHTDLATLIDEVKQDLKEELEQKNAEIVLHSGCSVDIIPFQFRQLFQNLISNSIKFSHAQRRLQIDINCHKVKGSDISSRLNATDDYWHVSIADNGIGFEPEHNEVIFEIFHRLHGKTEYTGTGIGLAIVKRVIENHKGHITANGELDKGATFNIYLPVRKGS